MPELEMFGCYANAADEAWPTGEVYLVVGQCSTGCHRIQSAITFDELDRSNFEILDLHETRLRRSFARTHSDA